MTERILETRRIDFWNGFHESQLTRMTELMPGQFEIEIACAHLAPRSTLVPGADAESQPWSQLTQVWIATTRERMLAERGGGE